MYGARLKREQIRATAPVAIFKTDEAGDHPFDPEDMTSATSLSGVAKTDGFQPRLGESWRERRNAKRVLDFR